MKWKVQNSTPIANLVQLKETLLLNRNIDSSAQFFNPTDPMAITLQDVGIDEQNFSKSIKRINQAIEKNEKIIIFGDYDADGICATATLWTTLNHLKAKVFPFIPHREKHGYGLSLVALEEILSQGKPDLVITVDNGIVAFEAVKFLTDQKIDVIVSDHHQPEVEQLVPIFPQAFSIVHSTKLCGASVAWMISRGLNPEFAHSILDLSGIATIADQVPLTEANRSFAKFGLEYLRQTKRPGLLALLEKAKIKPSDIDEGKVNFIIAPRINAMGRLEHGLEALRLLCTNNQKQAIELSEMLDQTNSRRKDLTADMVSQAIKQDESWESEHIIIVASPSYHEGVIGLIAGKLSEKYGKPAIAISVGETTAKASARSIPGINIVNLIRKLQSDLLAVGGHPMAAGFGFESSKLELVTQKLRKLAMTEIDPLLLDRVITLDCVLPLTMINQQTYQLIAEFEPFGQFNSVPDFLIPNVSIMDFKLIGQDGVHLKMWLKSPLGSLVALGWNKAYLSQQLEVGATIDLAANLSLNQWNGKVEVQLLIKDLKKSES